MFWRQALLLMELLYMLTWVAPAALAQDVPSESPPAGQELRIDRPAVQPDSALGALASIGCGIMVRATIATAGTQVGTIAGAIACCGYMLFDAFVVDPH